VLRVRQLAVLLTTGPLDQIMEPLAPPLTEEQNHLATILEAHQVGRAQTPQALALQADQVLEVALVLQVEVQVDPQVAQAQEDPEEGGINSPFFLRELSENPKNFVTTSTYPFNTCGY